MIDSLLARSWGRQLSSAQSLLKSALLVHGANEAQWREYAHFCIACRKIASTVYIEISAGGEWIGQLERHEYIEQISAILWRVCGEIARERPSLSIELAQELILGLQALEAIT